MPQDPPKPPSNLPTVLITGAFSGLGRAFFQHYARLSDSDDTFRVVGIDREPWTTTDDGGGGGGTTRHRSHARGRRAVYVQLDVTSPAEELRALARGRWVGAGTPVHLVIHCAGVRGLALPPGVEVERPDDVAAAEALGVMDAATMLGTFEVNVVGTFNVLTAVLPNLRLAAAAEAAAGAGAGAARGGLGARVVIMTSRMGSLAANDKGGGYAYRASKAALNAVVRSMSIDVPDVFFALVHPGRVETGLVGVKEDGAFSCEESLRTLLPMIDGFGKGGQSRNLCFVDRFGEEIPW